ncbi:DUF2783 domain-containing protein [Paracoccus sp. YLB-12]|uniref:DUF2783 domain-containing protein n=1 Tax=Paracoccus maritimus TaxID=2933292 RepID=A0ABT2K4E7_9RHOB|nr:DUF2783 domain-containing protein [Paracoccus sp. YLB-12]MCT4331418.1 DUF2783 domain-containing protein [Paracoccus sp. YLB-12]
MAELRTDVNLSGHDDLYAALLRLHEDRTEAESLKIWSRLVLLLANHIGDAEVVLQAIALARPGGAGADAHPADATGPDRMPEGRGQ